MSFDEGCWNIVKITMKDVQTNVADFWKLFATAYKNSATLVYVFIRISVIKKKIHTDILALHDLFLNTIKINSGI